MSGKHPLKTHFEWFIDKQTITEKANLQASNELLGKAVWAGLVWWPLDVLPPPHRSSHSPQNKLWPYPLHTLLIPWPCTSVHLLQAGSKNIEKKNTLKNVFYLAKIRVAKGWNISGNVLTVSENSQKFLKVSIKKIPESSQKFLESFRNVLDISRPFATLAKMHQFKSKRTVKTFTVHCCYNLFPF